MGDSNQLVRVHALAHTSIQPRGNPGTYLAAELAARSLLRYRKGEADSGAYLLAHTPKDRSFFHVAIYMAVSIFYPLIEI